MELFRFGCLYSVCTVRGWDHEFLVYAAALSSLYCSSCQNVLLYPQIDQTNNDGTTSAIPNSCPTPPIQNSRPNIKEGDNIFHPPQMQRNLVTLFFPCVCPEPTDTLEESPQDERWDLPRHERSPLPSRKCEQLHPRDLIQSPPSPLQS